ncbi:HEPN domain-containing protein [Candidatus Parvarchaeota archaeon]|uniref:HEPN domain-containing protein n=1 Tax=Candidatus Acidifodinimicrobium mancum TaxID=2898728 RepID=A0A8T3UVD2_9ARCH|nr:HEPN domain-containing protein [Candidatus Acidifodinimicrobium mancum]
MGVEIAEEAIKTAESWIKTAETMLVEKVYNTALYSEEMAVEIALKAVMLSAGIEPPKVHNIIESVESNVLSSDKVPKKYKEELKGITRSLLPELLRNRQLSGYTFNYNIDKKDLEKLAIKYLGESKKAVETCKNVVGSDIKNNI